MYCTNIIRLSLFLVVSQAPFSFASGRRFHSEIEQAEAKMQPWENTALSRQLLRLKLQEIVSEKIERSDEKVYIDRARRSGDPSFIPVLMEIAERPTPTEKEDSIFIAVRTLAILGVEKDYFYRTAKHYTTHSKLAAVCIDALSDPYDQEAIGYIDGLKKEVTGTGNSVAGAIMIAESLRYRARKYEAQDLASKIEMGILGAEGGIVGNFEYLGPNGSADSRWIHSRFRDLCQKYPDKVAVALSRRDKQISTAAGVVESRAVQEWVAQFLTPDAHAIWERLRHADSPNGTNEATVDERRATGAEMAVPPSAQGGGSDLVVKTHARSAPRHGGTPDPLQRVWFWVAGTVALLSLVMFVSRRYRH